MRLTLQGLAFVGVLLLALGGCTVNVDQGSSSGATSGSGGNTGQGGGGSSSAQVGSGGANTGGMGSGGSGTGAGTPCGGFAGTKCGPTEYCDYPDDICGGADGVGTCLPRPSGCPEFYSPTCACDGKVYGNPCDAQAAGFDVSNLGNCPPPAKTMFGCGHTFCDAATQYCVRTTADVVNTPDSYTCVNFPMTCGMTPACACLSGSCGGPMVVDCSSTPNGGFLVTCPGG